jgi:hypothetical protein
MEKVTSVDSNVKEVFDLDQDGLNELISVVGLGYLPGCSAPKEPEPEAFKKLMDD